MHALLGFSIAARRLSVKAKGFRFMGSGVDRKPLTSENEKAGCMDRNPLASEEVYMQSKIESSECNL